MKKNLIVLLTLIVLAALLCPVHVMAEKEKLPARTVRPFLGGGDFLRAEITMASEPSNEDMARDFKEYLENQGITWPEGSSVQYLPDEGRFFVVNTQENLDAIDRILNAHMQAPELEIAVQFVEFNIKDINELAKKNNVNRDTLLALWEKDKARLLSAPMVRVQPGTEATIKGVTEYIYPTDFTVQPIMGKSSLTNGAETIVGGVVEPSSFETREVGSISSVLPEIGPEGRMINLTMTPEYVDEPAWKNYGTEYKSETGREQIIPMEQPFFRTVSSSTSMAVESGVRVLMAGGAAYQDEQKAVYTFVTATLVNREGTPIRTKKPGKNR